MTKKQFDKLIARVIPTLFNDYDKLKKKERTILKTRHKKNIDQAAKDEENDEIEVRPRRNIPFYRYIPSRAIMQRLVMRAAALPANFEKFDNEIIED